MLKLRTKIQALGMLLVSVTVFISVAPVLIWALGDADERIDRSLTARDSVFSELMARRAAQMLNTARIVAGEQALASAIRTRNPRDISADLDQRVRHAGAELAVLMDLDGEVIAHTGQLAEGRILFPGLVNRATEQGIGRASIESGEMTYEMVTVPVRGPLPLGWLSLGYVIDDDLASTIKVLTGFEVTLISSRSGRLAVLGSTMDDAARTQLISTFPTASTLPDASLAYTLGKRSYRALRRPFFASAADVEVLLQESVNDANATYDGLRIHILAVAVLTLLMALIGASVVAGNISRPLSQLLLAARRVREGDYSTGLQIRASDEIGELAVAFNAMQEGIAEREERITYQAQFDELTGLPNRISALEKLTESIERAQGRPISLMVVDLSNFGDIGSSLGHEIGDALLAQAAERLRASLDARHVLARLEGEEFLVVMEGLDASQARETAVELLRLLSAGLSVRNVNIVLDVRIGICAYPIHGDAADKLLLRASVAKSDAIAAEYTIHVYEDGREERHIRQLAILGDLRRGVRQDELKLFLQPKIDLADNSVCGAEALVRWDHPKLGFLMPNEFIPIAEQSGNISLITEWALTAAIRECRLWQEEGLHMNVSINLSGRDLQNPDLPCFISELLRDHDLSARHVTLEITEQALVRDLDHAGRVLGCLRDLGTRISIDDFGTGYSSLVQIKNLPADEVKIDRSFVMELPGNRADVAIVRAAIELAHNLGMEIVAEGVENRATLRWLAAHACERAQGFLIARPMPADQFVDWVSDYRRQAETQVESGHAQVDLSFAGRGSGRLRPVS